jgi:phosphohistidine phosphatase
MKTLTIVRHAKSSWDDFNISDHDRPLKSTGLNRTAKVVGFLQKNGFTADLILSSSAVRAHETAKLVAKGIGYDTDKIITMESLYHASESDILSEVFSVDNSINSVMIFGHNPTLTYLVNDFLSPEIPNLPTTGTVSIRFHCDRWEEISSSEFDIDFYVYPRIL